VLTDSGGVQEETCILKVPCVTLRDNTERPETLEIRSNVLVGVNKNKILAGVKIMVSKERNWENLFGDGKAGKKIIETLSKQRPYFTHFDTSQQHKSSKIYKTSNTNRP